MNTHADDGRARELDAVLALVRTRTAAVKRDVLERFVVRYFGQVDPEDLAERTPADLYGAALSHWNFARKREPGYAARARVQSDDRGARLAVDAHDHRDRQRRHAVPRRFGDDGGEPPRPDAAPHHPSDRRGAARRGRHADRTSPPDGAPTRRANRSSTSRSTASPTPARLEALAADVARVLDDVRARGRRLEDDARQAARRSSREIDANPPPLPPEELAEGKAFLSLARRQPLHVPRLPLPRSRRGRRPGRAARSCRDRASASCARTRRKDVAASFAALPPEVRAYARRPELLSSPRSTSRSTVHRPGYLDYIARQALRRRGQRRAASTASSACTRRPRTAPTRPTFRCCGARPPTSSRAPASRRGSHAGKALLNILATYPRDELFQTAEDELLRTAMGILHLGERQRFRLFVRRDPFERFLVVPHLRAARELHDRAARRSGRRS